MCSAEKAMEKYDLNGRKIAMCFAYDRTPGNPTRSNVQDTEMMIETFEELKFEVWNGVTPKDGMEVDSGKSDEEGSKHLDDGDKNSTRKSRTRKAKPLKCYSNLVMLNMKPNETEDVLEKMAKENACCFLLYFIVDQVGDKFMTDDDKEIPIFALLKKFENLVVPVLFFIQANVKDDVERFTALCNRDGNGDEVYHNIPKSANMLIAYLPNCGNRKTSVAKILSEELRNKYDINTNLTNVNDRLISEGCRPSPKFGSTLIRLLYLAEGLEAIMGQDPKTYSRSGRYLAYAFLFYKFNDECLDFSQDVAACDGSSLRMLEDLGVEVEFCVPNGKMTVDEFEKKLSDILKKDDLDSCDCISIIVSTHGTVDCRLRAYDDFFSVEYIRNELSKCEKLQGKQKVIWSNACRGCEIEETVPYREKTTTKGVKNLFLVESSGATSINKNPNTSDILIALATADGKKAYYGSTGSTFIYYLCQDLKNNCGDDFLTILTRVMNEVALLKIDYKQQVTFTSGLRKLLFLPEKKNNQ